MASGVSREPFPDSNRRPLLTMEVSERHARTCAITRDVLSPANRPDPHGCDASRDVASVVSDVSILCPPAVVKLDDNLSLTSMDEVVQTVVREGALRTSAPGFRRASKRIADLALQAAAPAHGNVEANAAAMRAPVSRTCPMSRLEAARGCVRGARRSDRQNATVGMSWFSTALQLCRDSVKPSNGLEPSTPPYHVALVANAGKRWQRIGPFQAGFRALHASIVC
jgi:hypothetical protein